jgi:ubiquitin-protein ligase
MSMVRLRRLQADHAKLQEYIRRQPRVQVVQVEGDPPERYQLRYQVLSLRQKDEGLREVEEHLVEINLPLNYPRLPPHCRMLTPVFHPNIAPHAICIGDHWSSGESLTSIVARIGELLSYQSYNTKSPLNGEAARWVDENMERLPLDPVSFVPDDVPVAAAPPPVAKTKAPVDSLQEMPEVLPVDEPGAHSGDVDDLPTVLPVDEPSSSRTQKPRAVPARPTSQPSNEALIRMRCTSCGVTLRFRSTLSGKSVRCPACKNVIKLPEQANA